MVRRSSDIENLANMKNVLRRIRRKDQIPKAHLNQGQPEEQNHFVVDNLSGW